MGGLPPDGHRPGVPDFLAVTAGVVLVVDVRPADRTGPQDGVAFAATTEVAVLAGWRYPVVTGWRRHVMTTLDTLSAARRPGSDSTGPKDELSAKVAADPAPCGEFVDVADRAAWEVPHRPGRRTRDQVRNRQRLIEAARAAFMEHGPDVKLEAGS